MTDPHDDAAEAASEASATPQDTSAPAAPSASTNPTPPPYTPTAFPEERDRSPFGCIGCVVVVVLVLIGLWWLQSRGEGTVPPRSLVPADALLYVEIPDCKALRQATSDLPLWKQGQGKQAVAETRKALVSDLADILGKVRRRDVNDLIDLTDAAALAVAPGRQGAPAWIAALSLHDPHQGLRIINEDLWSEQTHTTLENRDVANVQRPDGSFLWYCTLGRLLVITPDEDLLRFALTAQAKERPTLAGLPLFTETQGALLLGMADVRTLRRRQLENKGTISKLLTRDTVLDRFLDNDQTHRMRPEMRLVFAAHRHGTAGLSLRVHLGSAAGMEEEHGFFYYAAWVILTPIVLIIVTILSVVLITLLMAAYFYLVAWWKGELSPPTPPIVPELSPQLKEDLATKPARHPKEQS